MEYAGENQGRREETHHSTHMFRRLFLDLLLTGWRGCASAVGVIVTPTPALVHKPLCNQLIHYHISSRGIFGINCFKLRNCAVFAIDLFATADRDSMMTRIHRLSVMIYVCLQAEFMETKYNSHIHKYGTCIFGKLLLRYLNRLTIIIKYFGGFTI